MNAEMIDELKRILVGDLNLAAMNHSYSVAS